MSILRAAALLLCLVSLARAEDGRETASRLVREGNSLIGRGNCASALDRFRRAKTAYPASYKVDVNIGTALECLGRAAEATAHFELFLDRADAGQAMVGSVRSKVTALRARLGRIVVSCPGAAPGRVAVDGVESPLAGRGYAEPGSRRVVVSCGTLRRTEEMQLAAGAERELKVVPPPPSRPIKIELQPASRAHPPARRAPPHAAAPLPAPERRPAPIYKRWWFWSLIGVAVVGATVGVVAATTGGSDRMPRGEVGHISIDLSGGSP